MTRRTNTGRRATDEVDVIKGILQSRDEKRFKVALTLFARWCHENKAKLTFIDSNILRVAANDRTIEISFVPENFDLTANMLTKVMDMLT